jgi:hypothetical protein
MSGRKALIRNATGRQSWSSGFVANGMATRVWHEALCFLGGLAMFKGRHFDRSVILLCVRWYLAYNLSLRIWKR